MLSHPQATLTDNGGPRRISEKQKIFLAVKQKKIANQRFEKSYERK